MQIEILPNLGECTVLTKQVCAQIVGGQINVPNVAGAGVFLSQYFSSNAFAQAGETALQPPATADPTVWGD